MMKARPRIPQPTSHGGLFESELIKVSAVYPFITFQPSRGQNASEVMQFYVEVFPHSKVISEQRHGPDGPGPEGSIALAEFEVYGHRIRCSDSFIHHEWTITPAVSFMIECASEEEQRQIFEALSAEGDVYMSLDDYGFGTFGWVGDKFGLTWQLGLAES